MLGAQDAALKRVIFARGAVGAAVGDLKNVPQPRLGDERGHIISPTLIMWPGPGRGCERGTFVVRAGSSFELQRPVELDAVLKPSGQSPTSLALNTNALPAQPAPAGSGTSGSRATVAPSIREPPSVNFPQQLT